MSEENEILNGENPETTETTVAESQKQRRSIRDFIDGTVFTRDVILGRLPYILFLMFLAIIYIANRYHSENVIRRINNVQKEIKDLRSEHIAVASELMFLSKQSEVIRMSTEKGLGLEEATKPPVKIIVAEE